MEENNELTNNRALPPDYSPTEFASLELLEQGDVDMWVRRRGVILIEKSKNTAKDCEAGKLASAITVGASLVMSSNPLAWLPLTIAAAGYVYTVFQEFQDTGGIRLIPMYRGKLGDILRIMEGEEATERHPLEDQIEYLSAAEKDEVLLINYRFGQIASILNAAPPKVRFDLYQHICSQHYARQCLLTVEEAQHYIATAVSDVRRAMPPQQATSSLLPRPEYKLPEQARSLFTTPQPIAQPVPVAASSGMMRNKPLVRSAYTLVLDNPIECRAWFGAQRTGKSYFLAVVSQELHRQGTKIYHINLGSYGSEEDVYWCHCVRSVRGDISQMRAYEANQLIEQALAVVDEFYSQEDAILIFDEWIYAGKKNNTHTKALQPLIDLIADRAGILTQTGVKRSKAIWTVAPEFVAGTVIESAKVIKSFSLGYLTIAPGRSIEWINPRTGKAKPVKFSTSLFDQISNNYDIEMPTERFAVDRICYIDNEWIEVGDLPPLDPTLRANLPATTVEPIDSYQSDPVGDMVAALTQSTNSTLWGFARDELGINDTEEIKKITLEIAQMIFEDGLTEIQKKFRLQSVSDVRYSYPDYARKVAQTHRYTNNICCCCLKRPSEQAHHTRYLGVADEPGGNLYPVCGGKGKEGCHDLLCHSFENWIVDNQNPVWGNHNTFEWENKLRAGFELLTQRV